MKNPLWSFLIGLCAGMIMLALLVTAKPNPKYENVEIWEVCGTLGCE